MKTVFANMLRLPALFAASAVWMSALPVHADDTEIYFVEAQGGGKANIMFLLDTSGSMAYCGTGTNTSCTGTKRIQELKNSFSNLIDSLSGDIAIGLARFEGGDNKGGYVIYPVRGLDEPTKFGTAEAATLNTSDDAVQTSVSTATLNTSSNTLAFPGGGVTGGRTGFLFRGLDVPRYAKVASAQLGLRSHSSQSATLEFWGNYEVGANLPSVSADDHLFKRNWDDMSDEGEWKNPIPMKVDTNWGNNRVESIDVTELVQKAVDDGGWCGGLDMMLGFEGVTVGSRNIRTHDYGTGTNPRLIIQWIPQALSLPSDPSALTPEEYEQTLACMAPRAAQIATKADDAYQDGSKVASSVDDWVNMSGSSNDVKNALPISRGARAAFRFDGIDADLRNTLTYPDVVRKATLYFTGVNARNGNSNKTAINDNSTVTLTVSGVDGNAAPITTGNSNNNISSRSFLATTVDYTTSANRDSAGFLREHAVDVTDLVREMMGSADWVRKGALMFTVQAASESSRYFELHARERGAASAARLVLEVSRSSLVGLVPMVRDELKAAVNALPSSGGTPLGESYTEVTRYMQGLATDYGSSLSVAASKSGGKYLTPMANPDQECASGHIVVMTDGQPSRDNETASKTASVMGVNTSALSSDCRAKVTESGTGTSAETKRTMACMADLAKWNLDGTKNTIKRQVNTHMVLFYLDNATLTEAQKVTVAGEGKAIAAGNEAQLQQAFTDIVNSVTMSNASLAAPGVAVNQLNRIQHLDQLYYAVFKPSSNIRWDGNLKRYRLGGTLDEPTIKDVTGADAVNPNTGFFKQGAKSWWSSVADGDDVNKGGARSKVVDEGSPTRNLFVSLASGSRGTNPTANSATTTDLTKVTSATTVPAASLGLPDDAITAVRTDRYNFLMTSWGDPLHSVPRLVNYGYTGTPEEAAQDPDKQRNVLFVSTNSGGLHAVDAKTGAEYFTFMPDDELAKTEQRYLNATYDPTATRPGYGLDGSWTFWRRVKPANAGEVEFVYAYGGKRRGGRSYYALDVTSLTAPKMIWQINKEATGPFAKLGQTWSEPALAQVKVGNTAVPVLVFGGGYSPANHDGTAVSAADVEGNAVYMVNAYTGAVVWWAAPGATSSNGSAATDVADMKWAIPGGVTPIDIDADGFIDHIYFADLGGQVFRADINNGASINSLVRRVEKVASLGAAGSGTLLNHRRFFNSPTVALGRRNGSNVIQVVVGSGHRPKPLSESTQDRLFVLDDVGVLDAASANYDENYGDKYPITESSLVDVTDDLSPEASDFAGKLGWYINLDRSIGEKSLSRAAVVQGEVLFTTFNNEAPPNRDKCNSVAGSARFYRVSLSDGSPAPNSDFNASGRYTELNVPGIPPEPQVLLGALADDANGGGEDGDEDEECPPGEECDPCEGKADSTLTGIIGTGVVSLGALAGCGFRKVRWYESNRDEATAILEKEGAVR